MKFDKKSLLDYLLVIIIFGLTGTTALYISGIIMGALGFEKWSFSYILGYIFLIFPAYQLLLLGYAFLFGRFDYFFSRQKKIGKFFVTLFSKRTSK